MFFFSKNQSISVQDAYTKITTEKSPIIDVREEGEYMSGHVKSAINIPLSRLSQTDAIKLRTKESVLVICQSGGRSSRAVDFLKENNVNAIQVEGGTSAWKIHNLPME
ncbi:MAG: hypothetical protein RLZZ308_336 [Candidatus Parcubacteria bacterium]|jgi:rhodanese-related sulfurtransferase